MLRVVAVPADALDTRFSRSSRPVLPSSTLDGDGEANFDFCARDAIGLLEHIEEYSRETARQHDICTAAIPGLHQGTFEGTSVEHTGLRTTVLGTTRQR